MMISQLAPVMGAMPKGSDAIAGLNWTAVELEEGWQMISTPVEGGYKVKSIVDYLNVKYSGSGSSLIGACISLTGGVGYLSYIPGSTPEVNVNNFSLIYSDLDAPDSVEYEEFAAYFINNVSGQTLVLDNIWV